MNWNRKGKIPPRQRRIPGTMNKTEQKYADVLNLLQSTGEILGWRFEAIKFILAPNTSYTPDFQVIFEDRIAFVEVKGFLREDANIKFKVVAEKFPEFEWEMVRLNKGKWETVMKF